MLTETLAPITTATVPETEGHFLKPRRPYKSCLKALTYPRETILQGGPRRDFSDTFNTHTPPELYKRTHVVAALGVTDTNASPGLDGWMLADFCAFWNLFQGSSTQQEWLHCLDMRRLLEIHGPYSHGHGEQERVVLDAEVLDKARNSAQGFQCVTPEQMKEKFKKAVQQAALTAQEHGGDLLVLIFGHGDLYNQGIQLGAGASRVWADDGLRADPATGTYYLENGRCLDRGDWKIKFKEILGAIDAYDIDTTILTSNMWSGGWLCRRICPPGKGTTRSRTQGPTLDLMKEEFTRYHVLGDFRSELNRVDPFMDPEDDPDETSDSQWDELSRLDHEEDIIVGRLQGAIHDKLVRGFDNKGYEHSMYFENDIDPYVMFSGRKRKGISLENLRRRWDTLKRSHPRPMSIHAPRGNDADVKTDTDMLYGGTLDGLHSIIKNMGQQLLDSNKLASFHDDYHFIYAPDGHGRAFLETILRTLQLGHHQMALADRYLELMDIPAPRGIQCCNLDFRHIMHDCEASEPFSKPMRLIFDRPPIFCESGGRPYMDFSKGRWYVILAFLEAGLNEQEMGEKLDLLVPILVKELDQQREWVMQEENVRRMAEEARQAIRKVTDTKEGFKEENRLNKI